MLWPQSRVFTVICRPDIESAHRLQERRKYSKSFSKFNPTMIITIAQLGVQYGHMGYYFITVAFMLVTVMLLSCCVPYYVVLLLDVMFVHVLHLSCLVCMYPNCFVAFPLYILVHGCPCFFIISNWTHKPHFWVLMQSSGQFWRWTIEVSN